MEKEHAVGKSVKRVDAFEKVTGRAKYTDDLCDRNAYVAKVLHSAIAHGYVRKVDISEAEKIPGVVKVVTCFDVPKICFPTAGHPWSTEPAHQDVADRLLLVKHVRFYGDDIAAVVAENDIAAAQAVRALKVEYEELPFVLDVQKAMEDGAPQLHEKYPNNILAHTFIRSGNYEEAIKEPGLTKVEGWYETPTVQHCHIENPVCYAYMEQGRIVVVTSTQIPHICRRIVGQALGIPWGQVRIIKPYIGGGFGAGIHNVPEAAVYGIPVIFGPNFKKFKEAKELIAVGGGFNISGNKDFVPLMDRFLKDEKFLSEAGNIAGQYIQNNSGASKKILKELYPEI